MEIGVVRQIAMYIIGWGGATAAMFLNQTVWTTFVCVASVICAVLLWNWKSGLLYTLGLAMLLIVMANYVNGVFATITVALSVTYALSVILQHILKNRMTSKFERMLATEKLQWKREKEVLQETIQHSHEVLSAMQKLARAGEARSELLHTCMRTLQAYLRTDAIGIYAIDESKNVLQLEMGLGTLPRIIEHATYPERMQVIEQEGSFLLLPFVSLQKVIVIPDYVQHIEDPFIEYLLQTTVIHFQQLQKRQARFMYYEGTKVYQMSSFQRCVEEERTHFRELGQSFVCVGMYVRGLDKERLQDVERILREELFILDRIGFNHINHMLYILLPACKVERVAHIRKQLEAMLKKHHFTVINWTVLENEKAG
ncbi:hypothetical protein P6P90_09920 [Ectobacillus antri]|jgi:hypothetical protein|uniref:PelD GGDEF domain-containing protein n=1 Tax=Ectobacillus antri TaxID=2486280 RepID=A0ABT6H6N4_9BACI|nr:hypothetical protein [Ectobacillus antri]MDG4656816.1 hypothetical protein [Ectobacillus antri]MDG5754287.1 hypothetical protein [Ectobacillus antri]